MGKSYDVSKSIDPRVGHYLSSSPPRFIFLDYQLYTVYLVVPPLAPLHHTSNKDR